MPRIKQQHPLPVVAGHNALAQGPGGFSPGPAGATGCAAQREDAKP